MASPVEGLDDLRRMFKEFGNATFRSKMRSSMKTNLGPVKEEAEFNAPYLTGALERSNRIKSISKRYWFGVDIVSDAKNFPDQYYGAFQEWGSLHNEAQPYLRPAAETDGPAAIDNVIKDALKEIDRIAK
jgi:phage protein, HK97 gp10 family